jgi:Ca2+/Na+ antiporter
LKKSVFLRDIGFLLASVVILGLTVADGKLFYWEGLIMVLVYILYVLTVIIMGMVTKRMARKQASESIRRTPSSASSLRSKDPFEQNPRRTSINDAIGVLESSESASQLTAADLPSHFVHEMWANGVRDSKRQAGAIWICIRTYLFPIFIQWPERKLIGRFVAVLNIVPTLALSLTTPCVCEAAEIEGENNGNDFEEIAQFLSTHSPDGTKSSPVQDNISISAPYLSADAEEGEQEEKVPLLSSDASTAVIGRKDGLFKVRLGGEHPGIVDITNYRYILYVQSILIPIFVAIVVASTFLPITDASSSTYMTGLTFGAITGLVLFVMTFSIFRKIPARRILKSPVVSLIGRRSEF